LLREDVILGGCKERAISVAKGEAGSVVRARLWNSPRRMDRDAVGSESKVSSKVFLVRRLQRWKEKKSDKS